MPVGIESVLQRLEGGAWNIYYLDDDFCSNCSDLGYLNYCNTQRGFRCVYPVNSETMNDPCFLRGGSWVNGSLDNFFRSHFRIRYDPDHRNDARGFRCAYPTGEETK